MISEIAFLLQSDIAAPATVTSVLAATEPVMGHPAVRRLGAIEVVGG